MRPTSIAAESTSTEAAMDALHPDSSASIQLEAQAANTGEELSDAAKGQGSAPPTPPTSVEDIANSTSPLPVTTPSPDFFEEVAARLVTLTQANAPAVADSIIRCIYRAKWEDGDTVLMHILNLIFEKATRHCELAYLCTALCAQVDDKQSMKRVFFKDLDGKSVSGRRMFRRCLLDTCQAKMDNISSRVKALPSRGEEAVPFDAALERDRTAVRVVGYLFAKQLLGLPDIVALLRQLVPVPSAMRRNEHQTQLVCILLSAVVPSPLSADLTTSRRPLVEEVEPYITILKSMDGLRLGEDTAASRQAILLLHRNGLL